MDKITHKVSRIYTLPSHIQLLITLRFYATGAFQVIQINYIYLYITHKTIVITLLIICYHKYDNIATYQ